MGNGEAPAPNVATAIRGGSLKWIPIIFTLPIGVIVALIPWLKFPNQVRHASVAEVVSWVVVIVVAVLVGFIRTLRMGLLVDSTGVVVRNYLWTYRFTWPELKSFTDGQLAASDEWALAVELHGGRTITATGVAQYKPELLATIWQPAELHGVAFNATGAPVRRGRGRWVLILAVTAFVLLAYWVSPNGNW